VRINAAVALGSITSRSCLGAQFVPVFKGLVTSLETAQNFEVFGEWQHQANLGNTAFKSILEFRSLYGSNITYYLVNQLCISLCRLLSLLESQQEFSR
jgi:hypothetical protein